MTMLKPDPMRSRDLYGYGETPPDPKWPGGAAIAVNFNLNVEGGENPRSTTATLCRKAC